MSKRAILLVLDSVGVGAMPDAKDYNDPPNCNTFGNVARVCGGLRCPQLASLGWGNLGSFDGVPPTSFDGVPPTSSAKACFGKMAEQAPGKDTTTGHWEMTGAILQKPLSLFPHGFPTEITSLFEEKTGRGILGNVSASGTVIIDELAEEQRKTGKWIVYTSADSVFQIAANEEVIPLEELYKACQIARDILAPYFVGRVIARPYVGSSGNYERTANRKDYAIDPPEETILEKLVANQIPVVGVGKIGNIFNGKGISESFPSKNNQDGMNILFGLLDSHPEGLLFVNLVDFDSKFGHRNNPKGYGNALEEFDVQLKTLLEKCQPEDLLIITADHGCDPTVPGTDHSREYVPLLVTHSSLQNGTDLGVRTTFSDIAQSLASFWGLPALHCGTSFLSNEGD